MIAVAVVAVAVVWTAVAAAGCIALGQTIAMRDKQVPSCCPHPESEAPETVRGEFRAVVVRR